MTTLLIVILGVWAGLNILYPIACSASLTDEGEMFKFLPCDLRKSTEMNWFGCWFVSMLMLILLPVIYIIRFIVWLCYI